MADNNTTSSSLDVVELLQITFIVLKLCEVGKFKDMTWLWVFSPSWIVLGLILGILIIVEILLGIEALIERITD